MHDGVEKETAFVSEIEVSDKSGGSRKLSDSNFAEWDKGEIWHKRD